MKANHNDCNIAPYSAIDAKELKLKANHNPLFVIVFNGDDAKELKLKANHNHTAYNHPKLQMQKN